jgi:Glyoxalase/Bleomycin resistance protein/Dioxygenase superfamily
MSARQIVQIAYAVTDVREGARQWTERMGAGPFFILDHISLAEVWHQGQPAVFDHSSAYGQWGQVMVELVQQHDVAPASLASAVRRDARGIHHVTWFAASLEQEQRRLNKAGWPEVLTAATANGLKFAFHDATRDLGHLVELYEPTDSILAFYGKVAQAANGWHGRDPVRTS